MYMVGCLSHRCGGLSDQQRLNTWILGIYCYAGYSCPAVGRIGRGVESILDDGLAGRVNVRRALGVGTVTAVAGDDWTRSYRAPSNISVTGTTPRYVQTSILHLYV